MTESTSAAGGVVLSPNTWSVVLLTSALETFAVSLAAFALGVRFVSLGAAACCVGASVLIVPTLAGAGAVVGAGCWQAAAATKAAKAAQMLERVT